MQFLLHEVVMQGFFKLKVICEWLEVLNNATPACCSKDLLQTRCET